MVKLDKKYEPYGGQGNDNFPATNMSIRQVNEDLHHTKVAGARAIKDSHQDVVRKIVSWVMGRGTGKATTCLAAGPIFKIMHK